MVGLTRATHFCSEPTTGEISYFEVASFLADIQPDYANYLDPIERKQRLVLAVWDKWPSLTGHEAAAFVQLIRGGLSGRAQRRMLAPRQPAW